MPLSDAQRARFARHLLLDEVGLAGQEQLCAARVCVPAAAPATAKRTAAAYLTRSGAAVREAAEPLPGERACELPASVEALAGAAHLEEAAASLAGAFAAVEALKAIVGAGQPARLPDDLTLVPPEDSHQEDNS